MFELLSLFKEDYNKNNSFGTLTSISIILAILELLISNKLIAISFPNELIQIHVVVIIDALMRNIPIVIFTLLLIAIVSSDDVLRWLCFRYIGLSYFIFVFYNFLTACDFITVPVYNNIFNNHIFLFVLKVASYYFLLVVYGFNIEYSMTAENPLRPAYNTYSLQFKNPLSEDDIGDIKNTISSVLNNNLSEEQRISFYLSKEAQAFLKDYHYVEFFENKLLIGYDDSSARFTHHHWFNRFMQSILFLLSQKQYKYQITASRETYQRCLIFTDSNGSSKFGIIHIS